MVLCGYQIDVVAATPSVLDFARRLILSQTFEALSGRLSDARAELELLADQAATAAAPGGVGPVLQASADLRMNVTLVVSGVVSLVHGCVRLAATAASGSASPSSTEASSACYAQELAAALRASAVVEHTCVALASVLRLWALEHTAAAGPSAQHDALGLLPRDVDMAVGEMTKILRSISTFHLRTLPAALESAAVLGPCASYTVLAHGIAVLSAMDGGGTHGLEPSVARGVSALVRKEAGERLGGPWGAGGTGPDTYRSEGQLRNLVTYLAWHYTRRGGGPAVARLDALLSRDAASSLVMRVARLGVQAAAEAEAGRPWEEVFTAMTALMLGTGPCRVMPRWRDATVLAADALAAAASLVGPDVRDLGEEWWRLAVAVAPHLQEPNPRFARGYVQHLLCQLPAVALPPAPLPPAPPAGLESALAGGVLPCLERLFRRTAASLCEGGPPPPEVEASTALSELDGGLWLRLAPVLAWGDARQAAALVRTIGKGLEATCPASGPDERFQPNALTAITCRFLAEGRSWLGGLVAEGSRRGLGGGGAGALSPAERQLLEMLAAAAAAWLPPLCRLLWAELGRRTVSTHRSVCALSWLPVLACVDVTSRAPATALGASATPGQPSAGGSWLAELYPVRLLGVAFGTPVAETMMQQSKGSHLPHLAASCCAVAAALPEEMAKSGGAGPVWEPQQLRTLGAECRARGHAAAAEAAEALAAQLVRWAYGSGPRGGRGGARVSAASGAQALAARFGAWFPGLEAAAALLPASPAAARACLGGCSNPACANLEGDSDAALPLRACAGCGGAASYCSRECQTAHWRSGHREACRGGAGGNGSGARRRG